MVCVCVFWLCCVVAVVIVVDCAGGCVAFPRSHLTGSPSMEEFSKHKKNLSNSYPSSAPSKSPDQLICEWILDP